MTQLNDAFDLAVHNGYKGTRHDWLAALKRDKRNVWWRRWLDSASIWLFTAISTFGVINMWLWGGRATWNLYVENNYEINYLMPFQLTLMTMATIYTVYSLYGFYKKGLK